MNLISIDEASKIIGVTVPTLRKWRCENTGPASYRYNGRVCYRLEELEQWQAEQLQSSKRGGVEHVHAWTAGGFCAPGERIDKDGYRPSMCKPDGEFISSSECVDHFQGEPVLSAEELRQTEWGK